MSKQIACVIKDCTETVTIASGVGGDPDLGVLRELGWRETHDGYLCDVHDPRRNQRLKTRAEIDEEIVEANQATRARLADSLVPLATLPTDSQERKDVPLARGCLDYFPAALAEVARLSKHGNDKHNPGEEMHHARGKSSDHADCIMRHLAERGIADTDGFLHDVKVAWRALAMLQEALEARGAPLARGAREAL